MFAGIALFMAILAAPAPAGLTAPAQKMAAVVALMASWWLTEAVDISITALLPLALYPALGIMRSVEVAPHYANHLIFLYIGGFVIALSMEKWNLHRRVALATISKVGTHPARLVLGFMVATAFLSMWISNTATTMMMLPVAMAVVIQVAESALIDGARDEHTNERIRRTFGVVLLLGIAYAASIGGVGTPIGTPTNLAFLGFAQERFPNEPVITFLDWSLVGVPVVLVFLPVAWLFLCRFGSTLSLGRIRFMASQSVIDEERRKLGPMIAPEKTVLVISSLTAFLWIFRQPVRLGDISIPGWSSLFPNPGHLHDATVGILMTVVLCVLPVNARGGMEWKGRWERFVADWEMIQKGVPWGVVILFGGGFALAAGVEQTGLAQWIGTLLEGLKGTPVWVIFPVACLFAVVMTEMTSNVATVLMLCPIIAEAALQFGIHPYLLLIPTTIMSSMAFMLPVATPPNAVVFSSGWITIPGMFRAGTTLDLIALVIVPLIVYVLGSAVFRFG
ncbi:MAG: SLC13/DASS family transporter [Bryobacterales bacterium]|nr:SLC13/DASS family transporter [Bryobacterales bacterium]